MKDVKRINGLTSAMVNKFSKLWRSNSVSNKTKVKLYETFVVPVLLYGSECWHLRKEDERRILTAEMTWLRRLLKVTRRDKNRNEMVWGMLHQEMTLLYRIGKRRLNWFGHASQMGSERLSAKVMYYHVSGKRNQGRQPKKWTDNIKDEMETRNIHLQEAMTIVWDRDKWKSQVAASSSL